MDLRDITLQAYDFDNHIIRINANNELKYQYKNSYELEDACEEFYNQLSHEKINNVDKIQVLGYNMYGTLHSRCYKISKNENHWIEDDFYVAGCDYHRPYPVYVFDTTIPAYVLGVLYNETEKDCILHIMESDYMLPKLQVTGTITGEIPNPNKMVYLSNQYLWSFDKNMLKGFVEQWKENFTKYEI